MPSGTANNLQDFGQWPVYGSVLVLYGYGLAEDESRARRFALTDAEGVGVATVLTAILQPAFGRRRPREHQGHAEFFSGGTSFPSGHATPAFAGAAGLSEFFDNAWYASVPVHAAATAVGFGRIGHDAHWLSDIAASAVFGAGTTELLLYMHRHHDEEPAAAGTYSRRRTGKAVGWVLPSAGSSLAAGSISSASARAVRDFRIAAPHHCSVSSSADVEDGR